jgi:flagellar motility protein MotE (MotC chaperone)
MRVTMHRPRLLPATIAAMALLLVLKSGSLVWAATGSGAAGNAAAGGAASAVPAGAAAQAGGVSSVAAAAIDIPANHPASFGTSPANTTTASAPPVSDAERALLLDLRHRRTALDERAKDLDQRGAVVAAAQTRLSARVDQLSALQAKLEQLEADRKAHDEANWTGLVHVYENMKPREAAQIFDALDMQVLLAVLDRMQPRKVAPVLAAMQPERARLATQMLAEMRTRTITPAAYSAGAVPVPKE